MGELLKGVSRSFYLTVRVLPACVRRPIGVAYLLARTSDTIADTTLIAACERLAMLEAFRQRVHIGAGDLSLERFTVETAAGNRLPGTASSDPEVTLLSRCGEVLAALEELPQFDREQVRGVLETIVSGQALDLERFASASIERVIALGTDAELEDYTYRVAGCVGAFWTRLCAHHIFPGTDVDTERLEQLGVRFGQGLQLVNILRDLPADILQGRCYVPAGRLAKAHLQPAELVDPGAMGAFKAVYEEYLDRATNLLADGWAYTNMLPRAHVRLRLACAWPILIGVRTISHLREHNILNVNSRVKVSRSEVRRLIVRSVWCYPRQRAWEKLFDRAKN